MVPNKTDKVPREIEDLTKMRFLPIVGSQKGRILARVVRDLKPKRVLEVGTLIGYSAILIGKNLGPDAHLITIEINANKAKIAEENINRARIPPKVEVIVGDAKEVMPTLKGPFDLVFLDAAKDEYLVYLRLAEGKLHKGSVVVADNAGTFADQMRDYLQYVRLSGKYESRYEPVGEDGLEISTKKKDK
jgi:predicted O-methyltransferase YrrM